MTCNQFGLNPFCSVAVILRYPFSQSIIFSFVPAPAIINTNYTVDRIISHQKESLPMTMRDALHPKRRELPSCWRPLLCLIIGYIYSFYFRIFFMANDNIYSETFYESRYAGEKKMKEKSNGRWWERFRCVCKWVRTSGRKRECNLINCIWHIIWFYMPLFAINLCVSGLSLAAVYVVMLQRDNTAHLKTTFLASISSQSPRHKNNIKLGKM